MAFRTPSQFATGWGSFHLRTPVGGCAKGIPLNIRTPDFCAPMPSINPFEILTRSGPDALPDREPARMIVAPRNAFRNDGFICSVLVMIDQDRSSIHTLTPAGYSSERDPCWQTLSQV